MKAILLRLEGPLQAWGTQSQFTERDSQLEPSKSGVIGMLCSAMGIRRGEDHHALRSLSMGIRVDREGRKLRDYHTVGGGSLPPRILAQYGVRKYGVSKANNSAPDTSVTRRDYLSDARFLIAMGTNDDNGILEKIAQALKNPVFPIFLGRKSFIPSAPILLDLVQPFREGKNLEEILEQVPWDPTHYTLLEDIKIPHHTNVPEVIRLVLEVPEEGQKNNQQVSQLRRDDPVSFEKSNRRFNQRSIIIKFTSKPIDDWKLRNLTSTTEEESA